MDWTQWLKELDRAVKDRNRVRAALREADAHVAELTAQAIAAGAPGGPMARILAQLDPVLPPAPAEVQPIVPPVRLAGPPADPSPVDGIVRFGLAEACEKGILPTTFSNARAMKRRSIGYGVPLPSGIQRGRLTKYTEDELKGWWTAYRSRSE